jgi:phosphoribosylaminoimidazolecarboxamide formyltransferase/IMP cyclohydrolase
MAERKIKRALIAVYDKTGIVEFARALVDEFGIEIISTGGTAKHLKDAGIPVTLVENVTGFPEMLDGRVKTLHPKIHAAILADRDNPDHMRQLAEQGIEPIDMVVVNLYPFEKTVADPNCTFEQAIEMIDIGGPCLLRAAAKNFGSLIVIGNPGQYPYVLEAMREHKGQPPYMMSLAYATDVFQRTSQYDLIIYSHWSRFIEWAMHREAAQAGQDAETEPVPASASLTLDRVVVPRYGENPHQVGSIWQVRSAVGLQGACNADGGLREWVVKSGGGDFSYNNVADADAAFGLCAELTRIATEPSYCCTFIKHTNACGAGTARSPSEAYQLAYLGDLKAAMGGVLAVSFPVNAEFAEAVMTTYDKFGKSAGAGGFFVEVWLAPSFDDNAVEIIRTKKKWGENVRLLAVGDMSQPPDADIMQYKSIAGGMLVQTPDVLGLNEDQWKVVTKRQPIDSEISDLRLAWLIAKHTKSNAISICKDGMLIGNGAGQMSRVMSCRIATWLAKENRHEDKLKGSAAASDAFFPFRDGPDILIDAGVTAIIQPGGSKRDEDTIKACDERGVAMIFTGTRHFKH